MPPYQVPVLHPSAILRGRQAEEPAQMVHLRRAFQLARGELPPDSLVFANIEKPPPGTLFRPTLQTLAEFDVQIQGYDTLSIDIENAGHFILLVGITLLDFASETVGPTLSLPFRACRGEDYWPDWASHLRATEYLWNWLSDPRTRKFFHNGLSHDVPLLEEHGFEIQGELWDTMVQAHYTYPEMRRGLQYTATLYLGMPRWKDLVDEKEDAEGKA